MGVIIILYFGIAVFAYRQGYLNGKGDINRLRDKYINQCKCGKDWQNCTRDNQGRIILLCPDCETGISY